MNSYNKPRNMSNKGTGKRAMPAPKLMAIENEFHRTKDALEHEIKRLQGEVGKLAKRYNNAKREIKNLVKRVRSQPPPPIPKRDEETERKREEQHERWKEHLHREMEMEVEKEKEKEKEMKKDNDIVMPTAMEDSKPPIETSNTLSPDQTPLDQSPQSEVKIASEVPSPVSTPPGSHTNEDVGMEDELAKTRVTIQAIYLEDGWGVKFRKTEYKAGMKEMEGKARRWEESCKVMGIEESEMGLEGDLDEVSDKMLEIVEKWNEAKRKGKYRRWGKLWLLDGMLYARKNLGWEIAITDDGMRFEE